MSETAG